MFLKDRLYRAFFVISWLIGGLAIVLQSVIEPIAMNNIIAVLKRGEGELTRVSLLIFVFFLSSVCAFAINLCVIILKRVIVFAQNANMMCDLTTRVMCSGNEKEGGQGPEQIVTRLSRDILDYLEFKIFAIIESPLALLGVMVTCLMMFVGSPDFFDHLGVMPQHGDVVLGSIIILMTPLHLVFLFFNNRIMKLDYAQAEAHEKEIQIATESLRAIEDVRSSNAFDFVLKRISGRLEKTRKTKTKLFALYATFQHIGGIVWVFTQIMVLGFSAWLISEKNSGFSFEDYMGFSLLCGMYNQYVTRVTELVLGWQRTRPAKRRISNFSNLNIRFRNNKGELIKDSGPLIFDNVWYKVGDCEILCGLDLRFVKGKQIAIVGPSGSGKSTLLKLAVRHLTPTEGCVYYGSLNINRINYQNYVSKVSYLSQKPFIFEGTILDNILLDRKIEISFEDIAILMDDVGLVDDLIKRVLDDDTASHISDYNGMKMSWRDFMCCNLHAHDTEDEQLILMIKKSDYFLEMLRAGLLSEVGSGGIGISGGQAAKIALARALVGNPDFLLLDEITASLDELSRKKIIKMLSKKHSDKGIIFVTHCLDIIQDMVNIYVLKNGRIAQSGDYRELICQSGLFSEMVSSKTVE